MNLDAIITAARKLEECGNYSIANPTCSLRNNPHFKQCDVLHRKATGSVKIFWQCPTRVLPHLNDDGTCKCHGQEIFLVDTRKKRG